MRRVTPILYSLVLVGLLVFTPAAGVRGDVHSEKSPRREWQELSKGRAVFEVSDPASVPSSLADAAEQSGCRYKDDVKEIPIRFVSIGNYFRLAIVFCRFTVTGSHQIYDFSSGSSKQKPRVIELPVATRPEGFRSTSTPGMITWNSESGTLEAESRSDLCSDPGGRHTYRFLDHTGFVLTRVEVTPTSCGLPSEWTTIWQSSQWSIPSDARDAQ
jgi:hypothetical protein